MPTLSNLNSQAGSSRFQSGEEVTAVVVDNGEPLIEKSLLSLRNQTVPVEIVLAPGPKTDMRIAKKYADVILEPSDKIGEARVKAVKAAETEYIVSCDTDTIYDSRYCEYALEDLQRHKAVKAGTILPHEWPPLATIEAMGHLLVPYEFALAFRKSDFLEARIDKEDYSNSRADIGWYVLWRLFPRTDFRMKCWTRFPTYGADYVAKNYLPQALAGLAGITGIGGIIIANELNKHD